MSSDTAQPEEHQDPRDGTAVIPPVTDAMLDHAAHEAAALADAVAHGTITPGAPAGPPTGAEPETPAELPAASAERDAAPSDAAPGSSAEPVASDAAARAVPPADEADAVGRYGTRVIEMMRANMASATAHFAALVQAKSVPDALSLNAEHLRRQMETMAGQGRELATLAQRIALDALRPFKGPPGR